MIKLAFLFTPVSINATRGTRGNESASDKHSNLNLNTILYIAQKLKKKNF